MLQSNVCGIIMLLDTYPQLDINIFVLLSLLCKEAFNL